MADTLILDNSIWPNGMITNSDNYDVFSPLGTIKVAVPTSSSEWPKGDKLVSPFVYEDGKLVGFIDTKALTTDSQTTIYLPYEHIEAEFSSINKGQLQIHAPKATIKKASWADSGKEDIPEAQFKYKGCKTGDDVKAIDADYITNDFINGEWNQPLWDLNAGNDGSYKDGIFTGCTKLTTFNTDLPNLTNGHNMFYNCSNLTSFSSDLSSVTDGYQMFYKCTNLESFNSDLPNLTNGYMMFYECANLTSFSSDLSSLPDGHDMFRYCKNLSQFDSDLPSLTNGQCMFEYCTKLESFSSDLSSLTTGAGMFSYCESLESFNSNLSSLTYGPGMFQHCTNLNSFSSDLSSLTTGDGMFRGCKLDTASVQNIADTIKTYNATISIDIGNTTPNEQEIAAFDKIASKGWTVYVNGSVYTPTAPAAIITLDENGIETTTPIPFWAKPVPTDEEHARYVDAEGNFFDILGGQFIYGDSLETYGMFTCEADAAQNMRLTPYTKPQTEIERQ